MRLGDEQAGSPEILYKNTKVNIEALSLTEGARFYATDLKTEGYYDGSIVIWRPDSGNWSYLSLALTYASTTSFTVAGDYTSLFQVGTKIKLTQTTVKYFYVVSSSYSAPNTTVNITGGSDYSLANAVIVSPAYSYASVASGFPGWFNWTPSYSTTGSMTYTSISLSYARFRVVPGACVFDVLFEGTIGGSASNYILFTAPFGLPSGMFGAVRINHGGFEMGFFEGVGNTNLYVGKRDVSNYGLGANCQIYGQGSYKI